MCERYPCVREHFLKLICGHHDSFHPVVDIIHLTATAQLLAYCLRYNAHIMLYNISLNRVSVHRRFLYDRHISDTAHCHVKRPWYRGSRKCQHINTLESFLELFLMSNTKTLFLVYDNKTQVLELNVFLHKPVRAYDKVDSATVKLSYYLLLLLWFSKPRQKLHLHREMLKSFYRRLIMLPCKNSCWHKYSHLLVIEHTLERCTESHLRFAEAHISAEKSVHWGRLFHI